jgi:uncharacterized membrane protein YfcA
VFGPGLWHGVLLLAAGLLAGAMNAAAGGGSFVTFPALLSAGVPSVAANATSTVALFPGAFASAYAFRTDFRRFQGVSVTTLLVISMIGGLLGAVLLLATPSGIFDALVPWLLLLGAVAFAVGRQAGAALRRMVRIGTPALLVAQFVLGVYGGYFGGAVGIMMMAVWSIFGMSDIRAISGARTLIVGATNAVAVVCFVAAGIVWWPQALLMMVAAVVGGYGGARLARLVPPERLRAGITLFNFAITAAVFWRFYA